MRKSVLVLAVVTVLLGCAILGAVSTRAQERPFAALSAEERKWLDENRDNIVLTYDATAPPMEFRDTNGKYAGIGADIIAKVEKLLGVTFRKQPSYDWNALVSGMERGETYLNAGMVRTPERERLAYFTAPYISLPLVIITTNKAFAGTVTWSDLSGLRVGVVSGYASEKYVREKGLDRFTVVPVNNVPVGLRDVSFGVLDAFVENLASASYYIEKDTLTNLRVAGTSDFTFRLSISVSRKYPLLYSAVQKALSEIPQEDIDASRKRWVSLSGEGMLSPERLRLLQLVGFFSLLLIVSLAGISYLLKRRLDAQVVHLRDSEERYRSVIQNMQDVYFRTDAQGGLIMLSPSGLRMYGAESMEELLGQPIGLFYMIPAERKALLDKLQAEGVVRDYEILLKRQDGSTVQAATTASYYHDTLGNVLGVEGIFRDITERKQAEEALRQSEEKFSRIFEMAPECISFIRLRDSMRIAVNAAFETITGYPREEAVGRLVKELCLWDDPEKRDEFIARLQSDGHVKDFEFVLRRKDGSLRRVLNSAQLVSIADEQSYISVIHDITEERKMQEVLIQSEKMMSLGSLAAGIAHEINNPLGIVHQAVQHLLMRIDPSHEKNKKAAADLGLDMNLLQQYLQARKVGLYLEDIQTAAQRASGIIRNMLNFSRRSESKRMQCNLPAILEQSVFLASSDYDLKKSFDFKNIKIVLDVDDNLPRCSCTETEIEQVILNLLRNAAQAMAMATPPTVNPRIDIRLRVVEAGLRIEVADNGPGMDEETQRKVLEPFFTTKPPGVGTGLGLSVSYFIITKGHGGRMWLSSAPGKGATFFIELPAETKEVGHA